jgi:DNA-binding MurR/RpiR family transcriptional regulator
VETKVSPENFDIVSEIRSISPMLSGQMLEAANYLIKHPEDVAFHSMREIARRADVPPVSLVRLAQRLGLSGYGGLRQRFIDAMRDGQRRIRASTTRNEESAKALMEAGQTRDGINSFIEEFFSAEHDVLKKARSNLTDEHLLEAAERIAAAGKVFVAAKRTSFPAAFTFAYALRKARPNVTLLDGPGGAPEGTIDDISKGDVLVAVTFAPFNRVVQSLAQRAYEAQADVVAITDTTTAPIGKYSSHLHFVAPTSSRAFPESALGATAVASLLAALVVSKLGEAAQRRIRDNERFLVGSGEYLLAGSAAERNPHRSNKRR